MAKKKDKNKAKDSAWDAFASTGELGLYMLYKQLEDKDNI